MLQQRRIAGMQHGKAVVVHHGVEQNHHEIEHKFEVRAPWVGAGLRTAPAPFALPCLLEEDPLTAVALSARRQMAKRSGTAPAAPADT